MKFRLSKKIKTTAKAFDGETNKVDSILSPINHELVAKTVPTIPKWIQTHHLTSSTIVWSLLVLAGSLLSYYSMYFLLLNIIAIALHIATDACDGALGRYRKTGLVRWGYYADHFGDFIFGSLIVVSFKMINHEVNEYWIFFLMMVFSGFFVHSLLSTSVLNKLAYTFFKILSPLEGQVFYIALYFVIIFFGRSSLLFLVPAMGFIGVTALSYIVGDTLNRLWKMDKPKFPKD